MSRAITTAALLGAVATTWIAAPGTARAHPAVDEARAMYEEADFEGALAAIDRALSGDDLTRDELLDALRLRALVHLGMGDAEAMAEAVSAWVALAPDLELDESVPPEIRDAARQARGRGDEELGLRARATPTATGVRIDAEVRGDRAELVRTVRLHGRVGGGAWERSETAPLELAVPDAAEVAYYAEAVGPGGVVVANEGSAREPLRWSPPAIERDDDDDGSGPWLWVGLGAGAAAVVGTVVAVLLVTGGEQSDLTRPSLPTLGD